MARPKLQIDEKVVEGFAKIGATNCEIAEYFGCDEATIRNRFSELLEKARSAKKIRLRQLQWQQAEKGNIVMLIWLGKQMLGQTEKIEQTIKEKEILEETKKLSNLSKEDLKKIAEEELKKIDKDK